MQRDPRDKRPEILEITWDEEALTWAAMWGLEPAEVESIIRFPKAMARDTHSNDVGHLILRHRVGDVVVTAGYRDPQRPQVLHVTTLSEAQHHTPAKSAFKGSGSTLPRSYRELRKRVLEIGNGKYEITTENHPKVKVRATGQVICGFPGTASDYRSLPNAWREFCRAHAKLTLKEMEEKRGEHDES